MAIRQLFHVKLDVKTSKINRKRTSSVIYFQLNLNIPFYIIILICISQIYPIINLIGKKY